VPGKAWIDPATGEKLWTAEETGETYMKLVVGHSHVFLFCVCFYYVMGDEFLELFWGLMNCFSDPNVFLLAGRGRIIYVFGSTKQI